MVLIEAMISVPRTTPQYEVGQLIHHRRYGYRGVIVAIDERCKADESWYRSNQTHPSTNQPWYHVLVDGDSRTTYVAESNLELDESGAAIDHPMIPYFFSGFHKGKYRRNDRPWEGWS